MVVASASRMVAWELTAVTGSPLDHEGGDEKGDSGGGWHQPATNSDPQWSFKRLPAHTGAQRSRSVSQPEHMTRVQQCTRRSRVLAYRPQQIDRRGNSPLWTASTAQTQCGGSAAREGQRGGRGAVQRLRQSPSAPWRLQRHAGGHREQPLTLRDWRRAPVRSAPPPSTAK